MFKEGARVLYVDDKDKNKPYLATTVFDVDCNNIGCYIRGVYVCFDPNSLLSKKHRHKGKLYKDTIQNRKALEDVHNRKVLLDWIKHQNLTLLPVDSISKIKNVILNEFVMNNINTI